MRRLYGIAGRCRRVAVVVALVATVTGSVSTAAETRKLDGDGPYAAPIYAAMMDYRNTMKRWPRDVGELQRFATMNGRPLDLSMFSRVTVQPKSAETAFVEYQFKNKKGRPGAFAVSVVEIR